MAEVAREPWCSGHLRYHRTDTECREMQEHLEKVNSARWEELRIKG